MPEFVPDNTNEDLPDDPFALHRQTAMEAAYEKARDLEELLNAYDGSEEELIELAENTLLQLNMLHGYHGAPVVVSGDVQINTFDPTTLSSDQPPDTSKETKPLKQEVVRSLGFAAIEAADHPNKRLHVRHLAETMPYQITPHSRYGALFQSSGLELPIDGSVDVQLLHEVMPPHKELLLSEIPDIMEKIDALLQTDGTLTDTLRGLAKIGIENHGTLHGKGGEETKNELLYYLNDTLGKSMQGIHQIKGATSIIIPALSENRRALDGNSGDDLLLCLLAGLRFSPDDGKSLALASLTKLKDRGLHEVFYPLSRDFEVSPVGELLVELQE